jgi:hypothetical protein
VGVNGLFINLLVTILRQLHVERDAAQAIRGTTISNRLEVWRMFGRGGVESTVKR